MTPRHEDAFWRTQGRQAVTLKMLAALGLAEMIVLEETLPLPPDPQHMA